MSVVLGLPDDAESFPGIDQLGENCRIASNVSILRHGDRGGDLLCLGDGVALFDYVRLILGDVSINIDARMHIGARTIVNVGCYLSGEGGLTIGEEVLIGPHVRIFSAGHAIHGGESAIYRNDLTYGSVRIENGAWVGGGATVLPGVTIGMGSVVGAGSVVTRTVPPYAIVAGNPAKILHYRRGYGPSPGNWLQRMMLWWKSSR